MRMIVECIKCNMESEIDLENSTFNNDGFYNKETEKFVCVDCIVDHFRSHYDDQIDELGEEITE